MTQFLIALKYDYLQRTRSYTFLITLCASLAIAYTFVPEPNANYSTIRISNYIGYYNAAWMGHVTAIMASVFLSLVGYYLVNSGIKIDKNTKIGQIIATTPMSNFKYLLYKTISNFLVLLTMVILVFLMSVFLFFLYNEGFTMELSQFIKPYLLITIPALFVIAGVAVIFEVLFGKYSIIQNIAFFFLFITFIFMAPEGSNQFNLDVFGNNIVTHQMEKEVQGIIPNVETTSVNIGYVLGSNKTVSRFLFSGIDYPQSFILSRLLWIFVIVILIAFTASFFHRFDTKVAVNTKNHSKVTVTGKTHKNMSTSNLVIPEINYSILPLLKTELMLLFRKGKKWLWLINLIGMVLLVALPLKVSYQIILPILWFLQVGRLSDLTVKEQINNVHCFSSTAFKPLNRLLLSQILSGVVMMLFLAFPLIIRLGIVSDISRVIPLILGSIFIVGLAVFLGIISRGKKLFEVLFFMLTYSNMNKIIYADYFGGWKHSALYITALTLLTVIFLSTSFMIKKYRLKNS